MSTLFVFGAVGFWILVLVAFILLMLCVQFERYLFAFCTVGATLAFLYFCGNSGIIEWIAANPLQIVLAIVVYILAGTGWSLGKWFLFVVDRKEKLIEFKDEWLRENPEGDFKAYFNSDKIIYREGKNAHIRQHYGVPEPRDHKVRILGWMGWWPWSLLNALLFEFFKRVFQHVYNSLAGVFRRIAKRVYGDVLNDVLEK